MEKEVERLVNIWKNEFALSYKDKPRLYNVIKVCRLDIGKDEIEPGVNMLFIVFYVQNEAQCAWVEMNLLAEMQERFAQMAELGNLTLGVDVDESQDFSTVDTALRNSVEITEIDLRELSQILKKN